MKNIFILILFFAGMIGVAELLDLLPWYWGMTAIVGVLCSFIGYGLGHAPAGRRHQQDICDEY